MSFRLATLTRIALPVIFLSFQIPLSKANVTESMPTWIPPEMAHQLEELSPVTPGALLGEVYACNPYCEFLGNFISPPTSGNSRVLYRGELRITKDQQENLKLHLSSSIININRQKIAQERSASAHDDHLNNKAKTQKNSSPQDLQNLKTEETIPLRVGIFLDLMFASTSLNTSADTDQASDQQSHPQAGGGLTLEVDHVANLLSGDLSLGAEMSFLSDLSPKSSQPVPNESWSSYDARALFTAVRESRTSNFKFGLVVEARYRSYSATPDLGLTFSSKYLWGSPGIQAQYKNTRLRILKSVVGSIQDVAPYRGTGVGSSLLDFQFSSCYSLVSFLGGHFYTCGLAELEKYSVTGSGSVLQPTYTQNPTYNYSTFKAGIEFKFGDFSF